MWCDWEGGRLSVKNWLVVVVYNFLDQVHRASWWTCGRRRFQLTLLREKKYLQESLVVAMLMKAGTTEVFLLVLCAGVTGVNCTMFVDDFVEECDPRCFPTFRQSWTVEFRQEVGYGACFMMIISTDEPCCTTLNHFNVAHFALIVLFSSLSGTGRELWRYGSRALVVRVPSLGGMGPQLAYSSCMRTRLRHAISFTNVQHSYVTITINDWFGL